MPRSARFGQVYALPETFWHSTGVSETKPCPLQAFWPWQELFADLQSLMPLQAFAPSQCTFADVPPSPLMFAHPVMNRAAAVAASAIPASFLPSISGSPCGVVDELPRLPRPPAGRLDSARTDAAARTALTGTWHQGAWMSSRAAGRSNRRRRTEAYAVACSSRTKNPATRSTSSCLGHALKEILKFIENIYKTER